MIYIDITVSKLQLALKVLINDIALKKEAKRKAYVEKHIRKGFLGIGKVTELQVNKIWEETMTLTYLGKEIKDLITYRRKLKRVDQNKIVYIDFDLYNRITNEQGEIIEHKINSINS